MHHTKTTHEAFAALESGPQGLSSAEAARRLTHDGPNTLKATQGRSALGILVEQFTAPMVLILVAAGVLALLLQDWIEGYAIFAIVVLFGLLGFFQEFRAEKALAALQKMSVPRVRVRREGQEFEVPSPELVRGDVVLLETGRIIPADCRVTATFQARVLEAALTGESEAVTKSIEPLSDPQAPLGDRTNMVYLGTQMTWGRAEALVVATGMDTELGKIAALLQASPVTVTPLQKRIGVLGRWLAIVGVALSALVAFLGVLAGESLGEMLILGVSMAVAIIPEGLPAVLTITLALGARRMLARHALIRRLPAVETLGSVTIICSDKTGTLTQNKMTVVGYHGLRGDQAIEEGLLWGLGVLCNDASPGTGDPTETCLLAPQGLGSSRWSEVRKALVRVDERPFDSDRKRMATVHRLPAEDPLAWAAPWGTAGFLVAVKGSPDGVLGQSTQVWDGTAVRPLTAADREALGATNARLANEGKRVLGFAFRTIEALPASAETDLETQLVFVGLVSIIDPPRPEVRLAMATALDAGIRPIMITGDHPLTALAIARDLGMDPGPGAITGRDLDAFDEAELAEAVRTTSVFARVSPEHKLRIVSALQAQNQVVAMTGDGVNDAPALRKADIGVAMGITGTDVAKEAGQIVLTDDNFASIVSAVEEGRVIYDNIRKYIQFSLGGNVGKVLVLLLLPLATTLLAGVGVGAPPVLVGLSALQLLWLNLLCDGLLSVGLGVEHPEPGVMTRKPVSPSAPLFDRSMVAYVTVSGLAMTLLGLGVGFTAWATGADPSRVQTLLFLTLFFAQLWSVFAVRTGSASVFRSGMGPNWTILAMALVAVVLQVAAVTVPFVQAFLRTALVSIGDLLVTLALGALMIPTFEVYKLILRRRGRRRP